jgi:beta-phosphoglucomutase
MRTLPTFIFDLDGVITNTEDYHFDAWKSICLSLNYDLSPEKNEELKGVSRSECLDKILKWANLSLDSKEFNEILKKKNNLYLKKISNIQKAKQRKHSVALYSSSKNARFILRKLNLYSYFDAIVDGNSVKASKPDPEGFILASKLTKSNPEDCVVFEDSEAGIIAGNKINMTTIGIGVSNKLEIADKVYKRFEEIKLKEF